MRMNVPAALGTRTVTERVFGAPESGLGYRDRPGSYAVIRDPMGRIAAIRTPRGFALPGGGAETGETPEQALRREVREEIGAGLASARLFARSTEWISIPGEGHLRIESSFFEASLKEESTRELYKERAIEWTEPSATWFRPSHAWASAAGQQRRT